MATLKSRSPGYVKTRTSTGAAGTRWNGHALCGKSVKTGTATRTRELGEKRERPRGLRGNPGEKRDQCLPRDRGKTVNGQGLRGNGKKY
jgi:hypothetical protein